MPWVREGSDDDEGSRRREEWRVLERSHDRDLTFVGERSEAVGRAGRPSTGVEIREAGAYDRGIVFKKRQAERAIDEVHGACFFGAGRVVVGRNDLGRKRAHRAAFSGSEMREGFRLTCVLPRA